MTRWQEVRVVAAWEIRRNAVSWLQLAGVMLLAAVAWLVFSIRVTAFIRFLALATLGYGAALFGAVTSALRERREQTLELVTSAVTPRHWLDGKLMGSAAGSVFVVGCAVMAAWLLVRAHPLVALMVLVIWLLLAWLTWRLVRTMLARLLRRSTLRNY